jgi:hypothetical protein
LQLENYRFFMRRVQGNLLSGFFLIAATAASSRLAAIAEAETKGKPVAAYSSIVITKMIIP